MVETTITRALHFEIMQLRQIQSTLQFIVTSRVLACLGISTIGGFYGGSSAVGVASDAGRGAIGARQPTRPKLMVGRPLTWIRQLLGGDDNR